MKSKQVNILEDVPTADLIPYARNARKHPPEQVAQIAGSIKEFGFNAPVLIDAENGIIAGHGRVLAAHKLGLASVPCRRLTHLTEAQKRAYILADNRMTETGGGWDMDMLKIELGELDELEIDLEGIGFGADFEFSEDEQSEQSDVAANDSGIDGTYTKKITPPIYEPKGDKPEIKTLLDREKTDALINEIKESSIPDDISDFLINAAQRHTVFHFARIAEFYCHQDSCIQRLMERSGLVIIDINKAIENGFVHLSDRLGKIADLEGSEEEEIDA